MRALVPINLALRFALEVGALAGLAVWGASAPAGVAAKVALGVGLPLLAAVLWGAFVSPKARFAAPSVLRAVVEAGVLGAGAAALASVWSRTAGLVFLGLVVLHLVVFEITGRVQPTPGG